MPQLERRPKSRPFTFNTDMAQLSVARWSASERLSNLGYRSQENYPYLVDGESCSRALEPARKLADLMEVYAPDNTTCLN